MMTDKKRVKKKKWPAENLSELVTFLDEMNPNGIAVRDMSRRTGLTQQYISWMMMRDDCKLSTAIRIALDYGYRLEIVAPEGKKPWEPVKNFKHKDFPNAGPLSGVADFLNTEQINLSEAARRAKISRTGFELALKRGDAMVGTIKRIAAGLGIYLEWKFIKIEKYYDF